MGSPRQFAAVAGICSAPGDLGAPKLDNARNWPTAVVRARLSESSVSGRTQRSSQLLEWFRSAP